MGKEICVAVFALAFFGLGAAESYASPAPRDEAPPFRFAYNEEEASSPAGQRALDMRLRREAMNFCRTTIIGSPVLQLGCRSAIVGAARAQLRARANG